VEDALKAILNISALIGGALAVATFWRNLRLRRAEWLYNLHAKFYESETYKRIRRILDYQPQPQFNELRKAVLEGGNDDLVEAFVDYLNFFEFVASLWKLHQLSIREIRMIFEYYILLLRNRDFALDFIRKNGFENLNELIDVLHKTKKRR
jgi:hypothetical protein